MLISRPVLQTLNIIVGSEEPDFGLSDFGLPEIPRARLFEIEELTFRICLSERDDEADLGIAEISCPELEALKAKFGADPPFNQWQEKLLKNMIERTEKGIPLPDGTNLHSAKLLTRPLRMPDLDSDDLIY